MEPSSSVIETSSSGQDVTVEGEALPKKADANRGVQVSDDEVAWIRACLKD
jgi:hypothetical protein